MAKRRKEFATLYQLTIDNGQWTIKSDLLSIVRCQLLIISLFPSDNPRFSTLEFHRLRQKHFGNLFLVI